MILAYDFIVWLKIIEKNSHFESVKLYSHLSSNVLTPIFELRQRKQAQAPQPELPARWVQHFVMRYLDHGEIGYRLGFRANGYLGVWRTVAFFRRVSLGVTNSTPRNFRYLKRDGEKNHCNCETGHIHLEAMRWCRRGPFSYLVGAQNSKYVVFRRFGGVVYMDDLNFTFSRGKFTLHGGGLLWGYFCVFPFLIVGLFRFHRLGEQFYLTRCPSYRNALRLYLP